MSRWAVVTLALAAACRSGTPTAPPPGWLEGAEVDAGAPTPGGRLSLRFAVEPPGLTRFHDRQADGVMARFTTGTVYEALARVNPADPDGPLLPWLATHWSEDADHGWLTIELREGVRFHDGSAFTSDDVRAVLLAVMEPKNPTSAYRAQLGGLARVETPSSTQVRVFFSHPTPLSARALLAALPMMPARSLQGDFERLAIHRAPIGTGPFRFVRWVPGESLEVAFFSKYWGPKALLERITVRFVRDDTVALGLLERGEVDVMTRVPPASWRALEAAPWAWARLRRLSWLENGYSWVGWNEAVPLFSDVRVRRALAMLYPADAVSRSVDLGLEARTTCPYPGAERSCDPKVGPIAFDPEAAKKLLGQAGWRDSDGDGVLDREGRAFRFRFLMPTSSTRLGGLVPLYQESLRAAGIALTVEPVDPALYVSRLKSHDFEAAALAWNSVDARADVLPIFHSRERDGGLNYVGFADPAIDTLLEQASRTFDDAAREATERELHRRLFAGQPYLFLTRRPALELASRRVHGLVPSPVWYDLSRVWVTP